MAKYVDGFLLPVPKSKLAAYRKLSAKAGKIWMEYGALQYVECVGDDLNIKGMSSSFPKHLKVKPSETVVFSWIAYKSKAQRNAVNKKVMTDPRMANFDPSTMPFDMKRMLMGGFRTIVDK
jgi:uncharacterized protein YbaA (DUF1428 family)